MPRGKINEIPLQVQTQANPATGMVVAVSAICAVALLAAFGASFVSNMAGVIKMSGVPTMPTVAVCYDYDVSTQYPVVSSNPSPKIKGYTYDTRTDYKIAIPSSTQNQIEANADYCTMGGKATTSCSDAGCGLMERYCTKTVSNGSMRTARLYLYNTSSPTSTYALQGVCPYGCSNGSCIKISFNPRVGDLIQTVNNQGIYFYGSDFQKHLIPTSTGSSTMDIFDSWGFNTTTVKMISQSDFNAISFGSNLTMRPGTKLIRFTNSSSTYQVSIDSANRLVLIRFSDSNFLTALYGKNLSSRVSYIDPKYEANYTKSGTISSSTLAQSLAGSLIHYQGDLDNIYYISNDLKMRLVTSTGFVANNFKAKYVINISSTTLPFYQSRGPQIIAQEPILNNYLNLSLAIPISVCAQDMYTCPGTGLVVSRTGPNCEFVCSDCSDLYWHDNNTISCGYRQFCGAYMYYGLKTFSTKDACLADLNK